MKLVCKEPGCGALFQVADDNGAGLLEILMANHVRTAHAPAVEKQLLAEAREFIAAILGGSQPPEGEESAAIELHNRISELLGLPAISLQVSEEVPAEKISKKKKGE